MSKVAALAEFLGCHGYEDSIECDKYDDQLFYAEGGEYYVLDDEEAQKRFAAYVEDSIWAFNAGFLSSMTGISEKVFNCLSNLCEDSNEAVRALVDATCGFDAFVDAVADTDGRGMMAGYDGEEHEVGDYYIYWMN